MPLLYLMFFIAGFSSGSVLYSYFIPRLTKRVDITKLSQDGNPGTANAIKHAGVITGLVCLLFDLAKGFFPVWLARSFLDASSLMFAPVIVAPVLGHAFSLFHHFKGGKAIAVSFGVMLALLYITPAAILLAGIYVLLAILPVHPNERKTVFAFAAFAFLHTLLMACPVSVKIGTGLVCAVVMFKNFREGILIRKPAAKPEILPAPETK